MIHALTYCINFFSKKYYYLLIPIIIIFSVPFLDKALHIDDPYFISVAKQIIKNPLDPYGFSINWYGYSTIAAETVRNPPLACYYLALVGHYFGWNETTLHTAFLLITISCGLAIYKLAQKFGNNPFLSSIVAIFSPVFFVSSTTLMLDMMMLSFFLWAIFFWLQGIEKNDTFFLFISTIFISLSFLSKYIGISAVPLLLGYTIIKKRRIGAWSIFFIIPMCCTLFYMSFMEMRYGSNILFSAANLSVKSRSVYSSDIFQHLLVGLSFIGGCIAPVLFFILLIWRWRMLLPWLCLFIICILFLFSVKSISNFPLITENTTKWGSIIQLSIFIATGIYLLILPIIHLWKKKDAEAALLFLWISGIFIFVVFFNWTINGRSVLLMVPPITFLLVQLLDNRQLNHNFFQMALFFSPLIPIIFLSLIITYSDYQLANNQRKATDLIYEKTKTFNRNVWFQGHWGFQYYMEKKGGTAVDFKNLKIKPGDLLITPLNNTNIFPPKPNTVTRLFQIQLKSFPWVAVMNREKGAGFYSSMTGPFPFIFGHVHPESFLVEITKLP